MIWELLADRPDLSELCARLADLYEAEVDDVANDVEQLLVELGQQGLVVPVGPGAPRTAA